VKETSDRWLRRHQNPVILDLGCEHRRGHAIPVANQDIADVVNLYAPSIASLL
jgi:hypothetical protein